MHKEQQQSRPRGQEDAAEVGREAHLLILGSGGAGYTSIEAVRPEDGLVVWTYDLRQVLHDVVCSTGRVYASTQVEYRRDPKEPARIAALRARDGTELWQTEPARVRHHMVRARLKYGLQAFFESFSPGAAKWVVEGLQLGRDLSLVIAGNSLLARSPSVLFAFDTHDGELRWVVPVRSGRPLHVLAAHLGHFYVHGEWAGIQALNAVTGKLLWSNARPKYAHQMIAGDALVYVWNSDSKMTAITTLQATDGSVQQRLSLPQGQDDHEQQLLTVTADGMAYFLHNRRLVAIRLEDERELWRSGRLEALAEANSPFASRIEIACSRRFLAYAYWHFDDKVNTLQVGALDPESGVTLWHWYHPDPPNRAHRGLFLLTTSDMLYLSNHDSIYAFQGSSGRLLWNMPKGFNLLRMLAAPIPLE